MNLQRQFVDGCVEVGIDEVGRGCLFGPVCTCAVYVPASVEIPETLKIRDSKKTTPKQRQKIMEFVLNTPSIKFETCLIDNTRIDEINILQATFEGMHKAIDSLKIMPEHLLVDGNNFRIYTNPKTGEIIPHKCVKQADDKYLHVSLAANIAKYTRDLWIEKLCQMNPVLDEYYSLSSNKGYGTKSHMEGIRQYGITRYHRQSFSPCSNMEPSIEISMI